MQLSIENVSKRYGSGNWALRNFTLQLKPGVLGLLGPNGAGKTTLMSILATITRATTGRALWNGIDVASNPDALRSTLGYLPQDFGVYPNLNAVEFLEYLAAVKGLDSTAAKRRIDELLNLVNLTDVRKRALGGFSGGMRQRVGIAQALLNDPQLLIVDEPTAGLALALGIWSGGSKTFEALYITWWYAGPAHQIPGIDFMGTTHASSSPALYTVVAGLLVAAAYWRRRQSLGYA